jgi:hypothetical protein
MKIKLIRPFSCAPEGHTVVRFDAGAILEGELAKMALEEGSGVEIAEAPILETKIEAPEEKKTVRRSKKG